MKTLVLKDGEVEKHIVWGEVAIPNKPFAPKKAGDPIEYMTADDIEKMAYDFMSKRLLDQVDVQHNNKTVEGVTIVESFIVREGDPDFPNPGAWVVAIYVPDDDLWQDIKDGKINGFSMEALVLKTDAIVEMKVPDIVTGWTDEVEGHRHRFAVEYSEDGHFQGGSTNEVGGHVHVILGGTVTQVINGHRHRFSSVDSIELTEVEVNP